MFDGGDRARIAVADDGAQLGGGDRQVPCVDQPVQAARETGAEKSNAMVRFCRMKDHLHFIPGMNSDSYEGHGGAKRGLLALLHYS